MSWYNGDGLLVNFDHEKIVRRTGGEYPGSGTLREIQFKVDIADVTTTAALLADTENIIFPRNSRIEQVEVVNETAAATITSLSIGLMRLDRTTEIDHQAFVKELALASFNAAGEKVVLNVGSTGAGDLVGTTLTYPGLVTATIAGSAGTGLVLIRVKLYVPGVDATPTNY